MNELNYPNVYHVFEKNVENFALQRLKKHQIDRIKKFRRLQCSCHGCKYFYKIYRKSNVCFHHFGLKLIVSRFGLIPAEIIMFNKIIMHNLNKNAVKFLFKLINKCPKIWKNIDFAKFPKSNLMKIPFKLDWKNKVKRFYVCQARLDNPTVEKRKSYRKLQHVLNKMQKLIYFNPNKILYFDVDSNKNLALKAHSIKLKYHVILIFFVLTMSPLYISIVF